MKSKEKITFLTECIEKTVATLHEGETLNAIAKNDCVEDIFPLIEGSVIGVENFKEKVEVETDILRQEEDMKAKRGNGKITFGHFINFEIDHRWELTLWSKEKRWSRSEARALGGKLLPSWETSQQVHGVD